MSRNLCLAAGVVATAAAIFPPLSTISQQLFAAHMMQHLLLIVVAAPLLAIGTADARFQNFAFMLALTQPAVAWIAFVATFLIWHWASAFQWAAGSSAGELFEHATILVTAFLFWDVALSRHAQLNSGARALYVLTAAVATDLPGVIMVFAPRVICTMPGENAYHWGITPLQDQQIAGLLMWVPANLAFFSVATWLFAHWISDTQPRHLDSVIT